MLLQPAVQSVFVQLSESLNQLSSHQYSQPSGILFNATIGQHVRHIIELFQCLEKGYDDGIINYDKRKRDISIETDKIFAKALLLDLYVRLNRPDKNLVLEVAYDERSNDLILINTNYYREIAYNLEHTVHHMALIRVGINEVSDIVLPLAYGVASSTLKFSKTCAP